MNEKCPLCESSEYIELKGYKQVDTLQYESKLVHCCSCGHNYLKLSNNIDLNKFYNEGVYKVIDTRKSLSDKIASIDDRLIILGLSNLNIRKKTLLDFGCGKGRFIYRAFKDGWKVLGIETSEPRAEFGINKYGLHISTDKYKSGCVDDTPFNVITLIHVLEHLLHPKELLKELVDNNLVKNGILVVEVPLFDSLQSRISGKRWIHLDPPRHISHFTKSSLLKLLYKLNLKPLKYDYFSIHQGLLGMVQSIMSLLGYKKMIISELKFRRSKLLIISILIVLPLAFLMEICAIIFKKGGVIRVYCEKTSESQMI